MSGGSGKLLNKAAASSCVRSRFSINVDFSLGSVSHFLLALSAKNRPPSNTASEVSDESAILVVGTLNHVKSTGVAVVVSLQEPLHVSAAAELTEDEEPVVVGKGRVPLPGIATEDDGDDDAFGLGLVELELGPVRIEVVFDAGGDEICDPVEFDAEDDGTVDTMLIKLDTDALLVTNAVLLELNGDSIAEELLPVLVLEVFESISVVLKVAVLLLMLEVE